MEKLGLSGDAIVIEDKYIIKICNTNQERFLKNITKQRKCSNPFVKAVPIIDQYTNEDNKLCIKMPYLKCKNSIEWLSGSNIYEVKAFVNKIQNYFISIIENCESQPFDYLTWNNKIDNLLEQIKNEKLIRILNQLKQIKFNHSFYYGEYHGDFTLSNLFIFSNDQDINIDAIDFLDSFIESPIHDLVKIRQDTKHLWTLQLIKKYETLDRNKILIILNFIDQQIKSIIDQNPVLKEFYLPFQILNLMRIVPYSKEEDILHYLEREIEELFNEFDVSSTLCR